MKRFIQGNWDQIKSRLKTKYTLLSDKDLSYDEGSEEELLRKLQYKLNMSKEELMSELKNIITHD
ncbi:MAG: hypothetical protein ACJAS3_003656 [Roseivirga sp.]|jgi:uncharacterized protein YjbJ (UPF0337 family)